MHVLWLCPRAKEVWALVGPPTIALPSTSHLDWLKANLSFKADPLWPQSFSVICWLIWKRRNFWLFQEKNIPATSTYNQILQNKIELNNLSTGPHQCTTTFHQPQTSPQNIQKLLKNNNRHYHIFIDASFIATNKVAGLAGFCLSSTGSWVGGFKCKAYASEAVIAEIKAIEKAVDWCNPAWQHAWIYTDCKIAADGLKNPTPIDRLTNILTVCRAKLKMKSIEGPDKIPRSWNNAADEMARRARRIESFEQTMVLPRPPSEISHFFDENFIFKPPDVVVKADPAGGSH